MEVRVADGKVPSKSGVVGPDAGLPAPSGFANATTTHRACRYFFVTL